jgi:DNA-binding beta-propeller fold protein YncE
MAESFRCPSCSAPLDFEGKPMQKCRFCGSSVIVPTGVIQNSNVFGGAGKLNFSDLSALTGKALKIGEIQRLIHSGNKIEAVKLFRETFGVGLKEANDAVAAMERGESINMSGIQFRGLTAPRTDAARIDVFSDEQTRAVVKKVGVAVGGSILGSVVVTLLVIGGVIALAFYLISSSTQKTFDGPSPQPSVAAPVTVKSSPTPEPSIAEELLKFGGEGMGAGKFNDNRAVAVDADGRIYAADYSGGRIQIFDADGNFQTQILNDTKRTVNGLAVDRKGNLFVLQGWDIYRLNRETGEETAKFRIEMATAVAVGLDGKVYVSAFRSGVTVLTNDLKQIKSFQISKDLGLDLIREIAVDGAGNLLLLEGREMVIFKLSPDGKLLTRFGGRFSGSPEGKPKSQFDGMASGVAVDSQGRIYVSQVSRISIFDANGNYLNEFKAMQAFGMALNDKDELFVASRPFVVKYKVNL